MGFIDILSKCWYYCFQHKVTIFIYSVLIGILKFYILYNYTMNQSIFIALSQILSLVLILSLLIGIPTNKLYFMKPFKHVYPFSLIALFVKNIIYTNMWHNNDSLENKEELFIKFTKDFEKFYLQNGQKFSELELDFLWSLINYLIVISSTFLLIVNICYYFIVFRYITSVEKQRKEEKVLLSLNKLKNRKKDNISAEELKKEK